jgi:HK97 family phage major capsid protein
MDPEEQIRQLTEALQKAVTETKALQEKIKDPEVTAEDLKSVQTQLDTLETKQKELSDAKAAAEKELMIKSMADRMNQIITGMEEIRTERKHFFAPTVVHDKGDNVLGEQLAVTLWKGKKLQDTKAMKFLEELRTKALAEGASPTGGYLVPPEYLQDLVELRRATSPLRSYITVVTGVSTNLIYIPQQTGVSTVAWVAENATKPSTDEVFGQIAINIFTLAGIAKISNQLLEDSSPAVDQVVRRDLAKGLGIEEDRVILNGSGTGQPTGILNTSGITITASTGATGTANAQAMAIYDDVIAAVGRVQQTYFGQPTLIIMHPRTWTKLISAKDTANRYLGLGTVVGSQTLDMPLAQSPTGLPGMVPTMFGIPVVIDANMPINQTTGNGSNRTSIIVGAINEAWMFERDGMTLDVSAEAGTSFEQNQTWFRAEERVGFTAQRLTSAFQIINDVGP